MYEYIEKPTKKVKAKRTGRARVGDPFWVGVRQDWYELNEPEYDGIFYQCQLCPYPVHMEEVVLDHIVPKAAHPELKYVLTNLQAAHSTCNGLKGSMSMEAYCRKYYPQKLSAIMRKQQEIV